MGIIKVSGYVHVNVTKEYDTDDGWDLAEVEEQVESLSGAVISALEYDGFDATASHSISIDIIEPEEPEN